MIEIVCILIRGMGKLIRHSITLAKERILRTLTDLLNISIDYKNDPDNFYHTPRQLTKINPRHVPIEYQLKIGHPIRPGANFALRHIYRLVNYLHEQID